MKNSMKKFIYFIYKCFKKIGFLNLLPSKLYLKLFFYNNMGYQLDLKKPKTFNEKLQFLKLYDRNPLYTDLVDKIKVKEYISDKIGGKYNIKILKVFNSLKEIDFSCLPEKFVIKCNHNSQGGLFICKDKTNLNEKNVFCNLKSSFRKNYFYLGREWPYKNVKRKIFAEELIEDESGHSLVDYKFFCFNGKVDSVMVCVGRYEKGGTKFYFLDKNWEIKRYNKSSLDLKEPINIPKPTNIDEMIDICEKLSKNMPFVRIDLYNVKGKIYFGELTFYPESGVDSNILPEADLYFGNLIDLNLAYKYTRRK